MFIHIVVDNSDLTTYTQSFNAKQSKFPCSRDSRCSVDVGFVLSQLVSEARRSLVQSPIKIFGQKPKNQDSVWPSNYDEIQLSVCDGDHWEHEMNEVLRNTVKMASSGTLIAIGVKVLLGLREFECPSNWQLEYWTIEPEQQSHMVENTAWKTFVSKIVYLSLFLLTSF